jgi:chemotaxis protein CheX
MDSSNEIQYSEVVTRVVENVFQTMLGMQVQPVALPWPPKPHGELITASISLTGSWKGAVLVECGQHEAFRFTTQMIGIDLPTEFNDDVRDAIGELANMVGGNLKSALPGGVGLSLPTVVWGHDYSLQICRAGTAERWVFKGDDVTFAVTLVEVRE